MRRLTAHLVPAGAALALLGLLLGASPARAQQQQPGSALPNPRLTVLTPAGGKAGTVVEVSFVGTDTEEAEALLFTHPGIKAEAVIPPAPPPPDPKKPPAMPPVKAPITKFKVTVGPDVPVGTYDARLVNKWGVSNPRSFIVGDLPEVVEKEPNNDVEQAQRIEMNSVVHGAIAAPTDVDYYVFPGKKGQRVLVSCLASSVDSRLNAGLELYDGKSGRLLASNRRYNGSDALLDSTLADDGDYLVRVYEFTHTQGNAEHFYRLTVSTAPWIDAVFPPMIEPGKTAQVTVYGRNLPGGQPAPEAVSDGRALEKITASVTAPSDGSRLAFSGVTAPPAAAISGFEYRVRNGVGASNPFLISFARAPVVLETEPNDKPETAQKLTPPCEVAGRIDKREDRDWYSFSAKKGAVYSIEVLSDRIGAPTDMKFLLRNPATKGDIIELDDPPVTPNDAASLKFFARSEDPATYRFVAPADGDYQLLVSSQFGATQFGPRHYYRLRITPEQPDFQIVVMPTDHNRPDAGQLLQGGNEALTVYALRQDGFAGDIQLTVEGLPKGVTCPPQTLGAGARVTSLAFTAAADAPNWTGEVKIRGTATVGGKPLTREARSATIVWQTQAQQNVPSITRLDRSLLMAVRGHSKAPFTLTGSLDKATLAQGDKATLTVKLTRNWPDLKQPINTILSETIPNLTVAPVAFAPDKTDGTAAVSVAANTPPGIYTLVLRGTAAGVPYNKDPANKQKPAINIVQFSAPVTLTVLPKALATVSVSVPNPNVKVGATGEAVVKVTRLFDYAGEFQVQVVLPATVKGLTVANVVIPAGKDEAKLILTVPADAVPGPRNDLVVKVTANWNGNVPVVHEAKFNVNVVK